MRSGQFLLHSDENAGFGACTVEAERKLQSQAVQRSLPRPLDVNASVLRPAHTEPPLTDLQKAEELIKQEMLVMQHYDALHNPTEAQQSGRKGSANVADEAAHLAYLERHPYNKYNQEELAAVSSDCQLSSVPVHWRCFPLKMIVLGHRLGTVLIFNFLLLLHKKVCGGNDDNYRIRI